MTLKENIKLLKKNPEKVDGVRETAKELIGFLEDDPDSQAWFVDRAMAGMFVREARDILNAIKE